MLQFERDFTIGLVSQWVMEEANKVLEHHNNCMVVFWSGGTETYSIDLQNVRSELENKIQQHASD